MTGSNVTLYTAAWCGSCARAKGLLCSGGIDSCTEIDVDALPGGRNELAEKTGGSTVPQIYIGERRIGGFDDLAALDRSGELTDLLEAQWTT